jgi:hypothetical protein
MKIKLTNGKSAAIHDIVQLQYRIGAELPADFLQFIAEYDGAKPENNVFKIEDGNESGISRFIPVKEITKKMLVIENLPVGSIPIALAECGDYIVLSKEGEWVVYFWNHEVATFSKIADSFHSFLEKIIPFDIKSVELRPEDVKRAWIDPDFLKSLKK